MFPAALDILDPQRASGSTRWIDVLCLSPFPSGKNHGNDSKAIRRAQIHKDNKTKRGDIGR